MAYTFSEAEAFNADIGGWNTVRVKNISGVLSWISNFDQDLSGWDTGAMTNAFHAFVNFGGTGSVRYEYRPSFGPGVRGVGGY
jgi:hypothetical protein